MSRQSWRMWRKELAARSNEVAPTLLNPLLKISSFRAVAESAAREPHSGTQTFTDLFRQSPPDNRRPMFNTVLDRIVICQEALASPQSGCLAALLARII